MIENSEAIYMKVPMATRIKFKQVALSNDDTMTNLFIEWVSTLRVKHG